MKEVTESLTRSCSRTTRPGVLEPINIELACAWTDRRKGAISPVAHIWKELAIALKLVVCPKPQSPVL
jgi:hypothetical protein